MKKNQNCFLPYVLDLIHMLMQTFCPDSNLRVKTMHEPDVLTKKNHHLTQHLNSSDQTFKMQQAFAEMVCGFEGERASLLLSSEVLLVEIINDHNVAKKCESCITEFLKLAIS